MTFVSNPFSTKFWVPGLLPYEFDEPDFDLETLLDEFDSIRQKTGVAQIVGPHGAGKTTLLETIARELEKRGFPVVRATLHPGENRLPGDFTPKRSGPETVFLLDGFEQLTLIRSVRLRLDDWRRTGGLVWTAHRPSPQVPILYRTVPRFERFRRIVDELTRKSGVSFDEIELRNVFDRHRGNFRNAFFELYDRFGFE